jgi:hypothetical protein
MAVAAQGGDQGACPGGTNYVQTIVVTPETAATYFDPNETYVRASK